MKIEYIKENEGILTGEEFANLYYDKLNLINKYSWMTIPPRILWKKIKEYSDVFIELDKIFLVNGITGDIDYDISGAYEGLSEKDKKNVEIVLRDITGLDYYKKGEGDNGFIDNKEDNDREDSESNDR